MVTATDASNYTLTYAHDDLDRVTRITYPDTTHVDYSYLCCGLLDYVTDRAGRTTNYDYDNLKRLHTVTDPSSTIQLDYDKVGNLTKLTDANNHLTQWTYDPNNLVTRKTYHDGTYEAYTYNMFHTAVDWARDANGAITRYGYDANFNLTGITYHASQPYMPYPVFGYPTNPNVSFSYNSHDLPQSMTDAVGTTGFSYDLLGRLTSEDGPFDDDIVTHHYDNLGHRDWMQINGTNQTSYHYDALGRLDSLTSPAGTFAYSYVGNTGRLSGRTLPNGTATAYGYDAQERLTNYQNLRSDNSNISSYAYGYDDVTHKGVRTWMESQVGTDPLLHVNYGYDTVNQLAGELSTETPTPSVNNSYGYDPMGNRTTANWGGPTTSYTTNSLNQYTDFTTVGQGTTNVIPVNSPWAYLDGEVSGQAEVGTLLQNPRGRVGRA